MFWKIELREANVWKKCLKAHWSVLFLLWKIQKVKCSEKLEYVKETCGKDVEKPTEAFYSCFEKSKK